MSTMLQETDTHWVVSTLISVGRRGKRPRGRVWVPKGDAVALRTEIIRQADAARAVFAALTEMEKPVV